MAATTIKYSMPRGDSRSFPLSIPTSTYSTGASIFFALKSQIDDVSDDSTAVLKKTLTDADITSNDGTNVHYTLSITPTDSNITPGTYFAEIEYVSADKSVVISYPDPNVATWRWTITGDVNRRTS